MSDEQARALIKDCLQSHWPKWSFAGDELFVWVKNLRRFDCDVARRAINGVYENYEGMGHPKMPTIMKAIRELSSREHRAGARTIPLYEILKPDGTSAWKPFFGRSDWQDEDVKKDAERKRGRADELYGKGHIVHFLAAQEEGPDEGYYGEEGCSIAERRGQARDKAFADILNGPDTKTRRWLVKYLDQKHKGQEKQEGSVSIGSVAGQVLCVQ
jgi:hypothetical protein